eukprot:gene9109-18875_t
MACTFAIDLDFAFYSVGFDHAERSVRTAYSNEDSWSPTDRLNTGVSIAGKQENVDFLMTSVEGTHYCTFGNNHKKSNNLLRKCHVYRTYGKLHETHMIWRFMTTGTYGNL